VAPLTPEPASPLYTTDIAQTPLPEVLVKIHRYRAPGRLDCRRGEERKRIYLERGDIIFAATNRMEESLGDMLLLAGVITREQYDESVARVRQTGKRHGTVLVEMKILSSEQLFNAVRDHIQGILWSIFAWDFGTVGFTPGRDKRLEFIKVEIPIPQAVMQGVRHMPDPRAVIARLGAKATVFFPTGRHVEGLSLHADEQELLAAVDGRRALYELVLTPPLSASENARVLYALKTLGLIETRGPIKMQVPTQGGQFE
jgi:Domain of unknown function (DUF4388)